MHPEPMDEHRWLERLVGNWTFTTHCDGAPGEGLSEMPGTERVRKMGDLWIVAEGAGAAPDGSAVTWVMVLGYDPVKGRFVGSWAGSPMTNLFIYAGKREGGRLSLDTTGPRMDDPTKSAQYQDEIEVVSANERFLRSRMLGDDGKWAQFMEARYIRVG